MPTDNRDPRKIIEEAKAFFSRDSDAKGLVPERSEGPNDSEPAAARAEGIAQQSHPKPPHLVSKEIIDAGKEMRKLIGTNGGNTFWNEVAERWDAALSGLVSGPMSDEEIQRISRMYAEQPGVGWTEEQMRENVRLREVHDADIERAKDVITYLRDKGYLSRSVEEEPVAWMIETKDWGIVVSHMKWSNDCIPLYRRSKG